MKIPIENIIYDEPAAIAEIQKVKEEVADYNLSIKPYNRWLKLFIVLFWMLCTIEFSWWFVVMHAPEMHWMLLPVLLLGLYLAHEIGSETYIRHRYFGADEEDRYSANAHYYLLLSETKPFKVLAVEVEGWHIRITYSDVNNVVKQGSHCAYIHQEVRTDITELSLNLPKSTLYVPYNAQ